MVAGAGQDDGMGRAAERRRTFPSAHTHTPPPPRPLRQRSMAALVNTDLPDLQLVSKGKVRDIYATSAPDTLLFVATDRISAYDVILRNVRVLSLRCTIPRSSHQHAS
jgi:hypothetical protein